MTGGETRGALRTGRAVLAMAALACLALPSAARPAAPAGADERVEDGRLTISLDGSGYALAARIWRPAGPGPFPLAVINHGTPPDKSKLAAQRLGYVRAARWFVGRGWMVVTALRPGFGASGGRYLEEAGHCADEDYVRAGRSTAAVEAAIVRSAGALPGADPNRVVVVGQSAGGFGAVALGGSPPPGVIGIVSFAGGRGGNGREHICSGEDRLVEATRGFGRDNRLPQLWLYAANDHFFRPALAHRMAAAFAEGSKPPLRIVDLPPFGDDGHKTFAQGDPATWAGPVDTFLRELPGG